MRIEENKIIIEFDQVEKGLMVGKKNLLDPTIEIDEELAWFEIEDHDGTWQAASARITSSNTIEVSSSNVTKPTNVRYAWSGNPEGANLYNQAGLPATVFTTEN